MKKLIILSFCFVVSACAQKEIVLKSAEMVPLQQLEKSIPLTHIKGDLEVLLFADQRSSKATFGIAKTGIFNFETSIYMDISAEEYVKNRFISGLSKRGVDVVSDSDYAIQGNIKKLWVWENANGLMLEYSNCEIEIEFEILSKKDKVLRYHGSVSSNATGTNSILDTTDSDGPILEICMNYIVEKFAQDPQVQMFIKTKLARISNLIF